MGHCQNLVSFANFSTNKSAYDHTKSIICYYFSILIKIVGLLLFVAHILLYAKRVCYLFSYETSGNRTKINKKEEKMKLSENQSKSLAKFRNFVSFRNKISLALTIFVLVLYYSFVLGVGLFPDIIGYRLGPSSITLGIIAGVFIIASCIVVTGLYTFLANNYLDKEQKEALKDLQENSILDPLKNGELHYKDYGATSNTKKE